MTSQSSHHTPSFLADGGEMSELIRTFDWTNTPLGAPDSWPQSLKIIIRVMLGSRYAMWLGWGPEFTFFYNDAYAKMSLGPKHPWALGRSAREVWAEIWSDIGPRAESVVQTGIATWDEGLLLFLERVGFPEETYHTFSYSPVPSDTESVGGILCVVTEDTERTLGERRLRTLRELAARTSDHVKSAEEACNTAASILSDNLGDVPFALFYLVDEDSQKANLAGQTGLANHAEARPTVIDLSDRAGVWPLWLSRQSSTSELVDLAQWTGPSIKHPIWATKIDQAIIVPIAKPGQIQAAGFLVVGLSPRLSFNAAYRGFVELVAGQIATAVVNARAYEEEKRRAEALAAIDRAKTQFFSNVSHELRTPLTLMLGPLRDALSNAHGPLPLGAASDLALAQRNAMRLLKLVNSLLDFSRIEAGRVRASFVATDVAAFTAELASTFRSAVEKGGLRFVVDCPDLAVPVYVDRDMWEKIVLNLLSNALKFTLHGEIHVAIRSTGQELELSVADSGSGIPPEALPRLFERFYRVEGAQGRTHEGTGIGLALVAELVKLHKGSVHVESKAGQGSIFKVNIPLGSDHLSDELIGENQPLRLDAARASVFAEEASAWMSDEESIATDVEVGDLPATAYVQPKVASIILADDNSDMRKYLQRLLSHRYDVVPVSNGEEALAAIRHNLPDLLLSDVMMPKLDGFGLLKAIRSDPDLARLPVVLLSARAGEEAEVEGLQSGADDYLIKPFSASELLARVSARIELNKLRRETERRLAESSQRLGIALSAARMFAWQWNPQTDEVSASDTLAEIYGLVPGTTLENAAQGFELIHPEDVEHHRDVVSQAVAECRSYINQFRLIRPIDKRVIWLEERGHALCDDMGKFVGLHGVVADITERKSAEDRLNFIIDSAYLGVWYCDLPFDKLIWNDKVKEHFGLPIDYEVTIDTFYERLHPDDRERTRAAIEKSISTHSEYNIEYRTIGLDGRQRWVNAIGRTGYNDEGMPIRFDGISLDITDKKNAERKLAEATRRTDSALMAGEVGTYYWDIRADLMYGDKNFARMFGVVPDEHGAAPIKAFAAVIHPDDRDDVLARVQAALSHNTPYEAEYRILSGGSERWVVARGSVERDADGVPVGWAGAIVEITGRKQAEQQLKESELRRRLAFDAAELGSWNINPTTNTFATDERYREIFHGNTEPISYEQAFAAIHPDDRARVSESVAEATNPETPGLFAEEYRVVHPDGTIRWVYAKGRAAFKSEGAFKRLASFDGTIADISAQVRARLELAASEERYRHLAATLEEQIEQRTAALEASNRQLRLSERMAALGTLSAGLGHDMGNLLVPVRVRLDALAMADLPEPSRQDVQAIQTSAEYLRKLAAGLRLLALDPDNNKVGEVTELRTWLEEASPMLQNVLPKGVTLVCRLPEGRLCAGIAGAAITQAVFNLVQNAGDTMRSRGSGLVTVWIERRNNTVVVGVTDDGPGMSADVKTRCMEPFFTTKPRDISTGLGLALVYGIVQSANGSIAIDTVLGQGTTFAITLPMADDPGVTSGPLRQGDRTAAIILREPRLQAFVAAELRSLNYNVGKDVSISADLFVIDDLSKIGENVEGRPVILIGRAANTELKGLTVIGEKPPLHTVRQALRMAAERGTVK